MTQQSRENNMRPLGKRLLGVILLTHLFGIGAVWLHAHSVRAGYRIQKLKQEKIELEKEGRRLDFLLERRRSTQALMGKKNELGMNLDFPLPEDEGAPAAGFTRHAP